MPSFPVRIKMTLGEYSSSVMCYYMPDYTCAVLAADFYRCLEHTEPERKLRFWVMSHCAVRSH